MFETTVEESSIEFPKMSIFLHGQGLCFSYNITLLVRLAGNRGMVKIVYDVMWELHVVYLSSQSFFENPVLAM